MGWLKTSSVHPPLGWRCAQGPAAGAAVAGFKLSGRILGRRYGSSRANASSLATIALAWPDINVPKCWAGTFGSSYMRFYSTDFPCFRTKELSDAPQISHLPLFRTGVG